MIGLKPLVGITQVLIRGECLGFRNKCKYPDVDKSFADFFVCVGV